MGNNVTSKFRDQFNEAKKIILQEIGKEEVNEKLKNFLRFIYQDKYEQLVVIKKLEEEFVNLDSLLKQLFLEQQYKRLQESIKWLYPDYKIEIKQVPNEETVVPASSMNFEDYFNLINFEDNEQIDESECFKCIQEIDGSNFGYTFGLICFSDLE
jgi:hypothetical protein